MATAKGKKRGGGKIADILNTPKAVKWFWIIVASPFALVIFLLLLISTGLFGRLPTFEELENPKTNIATEIYSEDGKMIGSFFYENRSFVDYTELNDSLVAALVATEDKRYYSHSGIDFMSLARVVFKTVVLQDRGQGGGSTITQQLAKNIYKREALKNQGTRVGKTSLLVITKFKEWITAVKLEYNYTKEEIIAMYLNTVEYGSNAYGIKSAAHTFFNKEPSQLTINESAILVGVVNAPTRYSPVLNPDNAFKRRNTVLERMKEAGFLDRPQYDSLSKIPIVLDYRPISHNEGQGTYFRGMLQQVMTMPRPTKKGRYETEWDFEQRVKTWESNPLYGWCIKNIKADGSNYDIYTDGLKIYTTINATMQQYAEEAVMERLKEEIQPAMNRQIKRLNTTFPQKNKAEAETIIARFINTSERYANMTKENASKAQIAEAFKTPVKLRIFTYDKEIVDTLMSPRDSVIHHLGIMRASFMAMDPLSGHVKAWVGGPNYRYFKYDMVAQGKRHVGSTIKPFIYTFAIDHLGYTPCTLVQNVPVTIENANGTPWQPKEASNKPYEEIYTGDMKPLWWGLANSRNNYSAWIMKQAKQPSAVADFIYRLGIKSYIDPVPAMALGSSDVTLFEMVGAYSTYVNRGVHTDPIFVTRIEDRHGNLISAFTPVTTDAISEQTAYTMLGMMENVIKRGTAGRIRWMYGLNGQIGGKTGTSQENVDAWFIGVTPKLVAGAWVGGDDQSVHFMSQGEGAIMALPIYAEFMKKVYADPRLGVSDKDTFPVPAGAVSFDCGSEQADPGNIIFDDDEFFD